MYPALIVIILLPAVDARRVIRAAPESDKTSNYIVKLEDGISHERFEQLADEILSKAEDRQLHGKLESSLSNIVTARLSDEALQKLLGFDNVEYIEEETYAKADATSVPWHLDRIDQRSKQLNKQYSNDYTGEGVNIYIIDTGIYYDHDEFEGRALYPGYDPVDNYTRSNQQGADCNGHGTHVASLAAGKTYGVAKSAGVYSVRGLNCFGVAPWSVVIDSISYAVAHANKSNCSSVLSLSLSGYFDFTVNETIRKVVTEMGIPVVVSAGDNNDNACERSPASTSEAITVGATMEGDDYYQYSNGGGCVDITSPGHDIMGAYHLCHNCTKVLSGTSTSASIVAGAVATLLDREPSLTPAIIIQHLIDVSTKNIIDLSSLPSDIREDTPNRLLYVRGPINNVWPNGAYTIPMSYHGCPYNHTGFQWKTGSIFQDNEDYNNANVCKNIKERLSATCNKDLKIDYCSKTETAGDRGVQWPNGSYCVGKKGDCPTGFSSGSVYWDDENYRNFNYISGTVPDGEYNKNTLIHYCCRKDSSPGKAIVLPSEKSFILIRNHKHCQKVVDMKVAHMLITTDDENSNNRNKAFGSSPYRARGRDHSISYCYYTPSP